MELLCLPGKVSFGRRKWTVGEWQSLFIYNIALSIRRASGSGQSCPGKTRPRVPRKGCHLRMPKIERETAFDLTAMLHHCPKDNPTPG